MIQTFTNFLFSRPSDEFENKKSDNNNLKSFKSFNDLSDFQKKSKPNSSNECCFPDRSLSCNLPIVVSDEFDMFCSLSDFSPEKKKFEDIGGSLRLPQPKTVLPKFNPDQNHNFCTPNRDKSPVDIQNGSNNCFSSQFREGALTEETEYLPELAGSETSKRKPLPEVDTPKVGSPETGTSLSELVQSRPDVKPSKLTNDLSKSTNNNASFKGFGTKKKN